MAAKKAAAKKGTAKKKRRLGMGLSGMIGSPVEVKSPAAARVMVSSEPAPSPAALKGVSVNEIRPNARQPRHAADGASLEPLVASIRTAGVMQPIVVRPKGGDGLHELVAGERRWLAARKAGLAVVPAVIRDIDDRTAAEWAIIENVQREDLDAIERGDAFRALQDDFGLTHAEIAEQVGLSRAGVTNQIRLCDLDEGIRTLIRRGALSGGHGRSLLGVVSVDHRIAIARQAIEGEWSVRELERRVRAIAATTRPTKTKGLPHAAGRAHLDDLERQLSEHLGTKVHINTGRVKDRGRLAIEFYDLEQFDGLLSRLGFKAG
jgi:ParB family chromosome partitioning protein